MTDPAAGDRPAPPDESPHGTPDAAADRTPGDAPPDEAPDGPTTAADEPLRRPRTPKPPADKYAIGALVTALLALFPLAVVLGHIALARIRVFGVGGHGLAVTALVIGYVGLVVGLAAWTLYFAVVAPEVTLP